MFYVYGLIDSSTGQCFYVGKGCKDRMYYHAQKVKRGATTQNPHLDRKIAKLLREDVPIQYVKFFDNITDEQHAYELEEQQIRTLGIDTLCNLWYGGLSSRIPTEEVRRRISENRKGIPVSAETREKQRLAKLGTHQSDAARNKKSARLKGKPQTPAQTEANKQRSASMKGKLKSPEHKEKLRAAKIRNPVKYWQGKSLSQEHKDKIRASVLSTLEGKNEQSNE
jgi:NUMOD3 motif